MRAIDLFSGPGGLSLGFKSIGTEIVCSVEQNKHAFDTYCRHTTPPTHINKDIREVDFTSFKNKIDVVFGGPPCQPFSSGGLRRGDRDARDMIPEFLRVLFETQPCCFLMENVPGLVSHQNYFKTILGSFESLGYLVSWKVLNAADYGVPQKRKRLFVVGFREKEFKFPLPSHGEGLPYVASGSVVGLDGHGEAPSCLVRYAKNPDLRPSPYAGHLYNGGGRPLNLKEPAPTILASSGGHKTHWIDTQGVVPEYHAHLSRGGPAWSGSVPGARRLSVEECAALQTFPPEMTFSGPKSAQYKQVGDAVPPRLAMVLARAVALHLTQNRSVP